MSSSRPILRRLSATMLAVGLVAALMAVPTSAATTAVTGTLSYAESVTLTPDAVAVVTIVDQTASPDAGAIVGEEWIGAPTTIPIDFSVLDRQRDPRPDPRLRPVRDHHRWRQRLAERPR